MPVAFLLPLLQLAAVDAPAPVGEALSVACAAGVVAGDAPEPVPGLAPEPAKDADGESYVLPETGFVFVIPGEEPVQAAEPVLPPCEPVAPPPVRPRDPAIFGFHALPVTNGPIGARWQAGQLLALAEDDPRAASLTWQLGANPLEAVNLRVNSEFRQVDDTGGDNWASAAQTLVRGAGDCEDLAILKLALLERAGIDRDRLFLVIVRDTVRRIDHAVAAVRWENRLWVLDNRVDRLQPAEMVTDYVPLQGFSGPWAWTYGYRDGTSASRTARAAGH